MKKIQLVFLAKAFLFFGSSAHAAPSMIKTEFDQDRIFALVTFSGVEAKMLLDSGGNTGIYPEFGFYWKTDGSKTEDGQLKFTQKSPFDSFPEDTLTHHSIRLLVGNDEELVLIRKIVKDGLFGHGWFGNRKWRINYQKKTLELLDTISKPKGNVVPLSFKGPGYFYPKFSIKVDGVMLDVLFDTGATSFLTEVAMKEMGKGSSFVASSFMRASVFDQWREKHPNWKFIPRGDRLGSHDLIQVPTVEIAGQSVGPVWFSRQSNQGYDEMMFELMDCKCAGAIGGNVLKNFEITLDYPGKRAWFFKN